MKYLLLADPHCHNFKNHSTIGDGGMNSRLADILRSWEQAITESYEMGCRYCLIAGDMFHVRGMVKPSVFNVVYGFLMKTFKTLGIHFIMIPGNHDQEFMSYDGHSSIDTLDEIVGVSVLKNDTIRFGKRGDVILGIPHCRSTEDFKRLFEQGVQEHNPDIILIHQGIDNFKLRDVMPDTQITVDYLQSHTNAWIIAGHYHEPCSHGRVIQVGALVQHTFDDEGSERGYWVLDTDTMEACFYPLNVAPKFITVTKEKDVKKAGGNFVRIKVDSIKAAEKLEKACKEAGAKSVVVQLERKFVTAHEKSIKLSTPYKMLCEYIDLMPEYREQKDRILEMYNRVCS